MKIIDSVLGNLSCKEYKNLHGDALYLLNTATGNIYVFIKKITPAFLPHNKDIARIQIPNLPAFEDVIRSTCLFFAIGYDPVNNVYVVWNPETVKTRLNKKSNISLYSTYSGQQEVAKTRKSIHYVSKQLQDAMIIPPSELQVVIEHYSSFFNIIEMDTKADLSGVEETLDWESQYTDENGKLTRLANPELLKLLKPCFDSPYPTYVQAYNIIEDFYGVDRFPAMQFKDWEYLLTHIDWNVPLNNAQPQTHQQKKLQKKNFWSEEEMILTLNLYYRLPFAKFHKGNKEIIALSKLIGRTPSSVAMRLCNYEYLVSGKGLNGGKKQCQPYLEKYRNNSTQLKKDAELIMAKLSKNQNFIKLQQKEVKKSKIKERKIIKNSVHNLKYYERCIHEIDKSSFAKRKYIMLLSILDYLPNCPSDDDRYNYLPLLATWEGLYLKYAKEKNVSVGRESTSFSTPFILLEEAPFWRLISYHPELKNTGRAIKTFEKLQDIYKGVEIDAELAEIIMNPNDREALRKVILNKLEN